MAKQNWVWMPHPAHFIGSLDCRFHLATYVNGYIVSTVGEYWPDAEVRRIFATSRTQFFPEKKFDLSLRGDAFDREYMKVFGYEEIGFQRLYETMVFKANTRDEQEEEYMCCPFKCDYSEGELDFEGYNTATDAYKGHLALCEKWDQVKKEEEELCLTNAR